MHNIKDVFNHSRPSASYPRYFLPYFILPFNYYSCVCFFLLLHPCCFHARGILREIHTSCMGSPFPVHAEWSLVFWSFRIMRKRWVTNDNNNNRRMLYHNLQRCDIMARYIVDQPSVTDVARQAMFLSRRPGVSCVKHN